MIIVLSPAKTLDYTTPAQSETATRPAMVEDAALLVDVLRASTPAQVSALMGISDRLAALNVARYEAWKKRFTRRNAKQAILAFAGDVYTGLAAHELLPADLDWVQRHVRILSGLYGVLRPLDLMQAYRLEMGTRLATARGKNLYEFWGAKIAMALNRAIPAAGERVIVNLASDEYFRAVDRRALRAPVVQPVFQDWNAGRYQVLSFFAKRARGLMTRYAIDRRIQTVIDLKAFDVDGYAFAPGSSDEATWVFRRKTRPADAA